MENSAEINTRTTRSSTLNGVEEKPDVTMEKHEFRAIIKHFWFAGNTPTEIHDILQKVHGINAPVFSTIKYWVAEFKRGRISTQDGPRSGRPRNDGTN